MGTAVDHRQSPRVRVAEIRVGLVGGDLTLQGNLSTGGVGFELDGTHRIRVGEPITVSVRIPELLDPVALSATVCHVQARPAGGGMYVGARFEDVDELVSNPLYRFVEESALLHRAAAI